MRTETLRLKLPKDLLMVLRHGGILDQIQCPKCQGKGCLMVWAQVRAPCDRLTTCSLCHGLGMIWAMKPPDKEG